LEPVIVAKTIELSPHWSELWMTYRWGSEEQLQRREATAAAAAAVAGGDSAVEGEEEEEDDYFDNDVEYATDEYLAGLWVYVTFKL
jgi:hypothetical protein